VVIKLDPAEVSIKELKEVSKEEKTLTHEKNTVKSNKKENHNEKKEVALKPKSRPYVLNAKVYKLKSNFVKNSIFITLGYIEEDGKNRPYEIFINSKDLSKAAEFAVLTRLISAIFRKTHDPSFILEELKSIHDPNGGYFKNGKYIHSLYAEIADVMEEFFVDIGLLKKESDKTLLEFSVPPLNIKAVNTSKPIQEKSASSGSKIEKIQQALPIKAVNSDPLLNRGNEEVSNEPQLLDAGEQFKICPQCNMKTLKVEEGCFVCMNSECNYSKCD